jgi:hypothetical protein
MTEQPATTAPVEPLDYIGTEPPPIGYVRLGWACPRDEALRCSGCDETDATPDMCGSGHPAYRSQKWIAYAGRPLPFPSAPASTGEQPASPAAVVDYTERALQAARDAVESVPTELWIDRRNSETIAQAIAADFAEFASAVASERDAAAIRAFGKRVWSDTEETAYQAGVRDTRERLQVSDRSTMQPALYEAANAACIYQYTDGFCVTRNSPTCERCWGNAWRVMDATGLSARATAWLFQHGPVVERLATMPAGKGETPHPDSTEKTDG